MSKFCPHCGTPLEKGDLYCVGCGAKLTPEEMVTDDTPDTGAAAGSGAPKVIFATSNSTLQSLEEKYLTYEGRLNRKPYFIRGIILAIVGWIGSKLWALDTAVLFILGALLCVGCWVAGWFLIIRRLHDLNKTGWLALIYIIPIIGFIFALVLLLMKGTDGPNQYGPDPLAGIQEQ